MSTSVLRGVALAGSPRAVPVRPPAPPVPAADDPSLIVDSARGEAATIVSEAHVEAETIRREARDDGYRAGRDTALAEVAATLAALEGICDRLGEHRALLEQEAGEQAAVLAVEIAAKLLRAELSIAPERVVDVVRGAIRRASERSALVVRVHPDDLAVCRDAAPEIMERMGGIGSLEIVDEPRMDRGSCRVQTTAGDVDAGFSTQLARVLEALTAPPDAELLGQAGDDVGAG